MIRAVAVCRGCLLGVVHNRTFYCGDRLPPARDPMASPREIAKYAMRPR